MLVNTNLEALFSVLIYQIATYILNYYLVEKNNNFIWLKNDRTNL
jgi:hypothetical protein